MQENNQNHQPMDQRGRLLTHTEDLGAKARRVHINDAYGMRTTLSRTYGVHMLGSLVNNKLNNKINNKPTNPKPFPLMGTKTDTQPKHYTTKSIKLNNNDFWYKCKKYSLTANEYVLAESIFQFMYQNGETSWN